MLRITQSANILQISWSDHAPIMLTLCLGTPNPKPCHWQLNHFLLQHLPAKTELEMNTTLLKMTLLMFHFLVCGRPIRSLYCNLYSYEKGCTGCKSAHQKRT